MMTDELTTEGLSKKVDAIVGQVQSFLHSEKGEYYDNRLVAGAVSHCVANMIDRLEEGLLETFTSPASLEYQELLAFIEQNQPLAKEIAEVEEAVYLAEEFGVDSLFEGYRPFSKRKLSAMMEYLTRKGSHVYKTSLNKLLFYSDLTCFYLTNHGMSGSVYVNRPFGPVADPADPILSELVRDEKINIEPRMKTLLAGGANESDEILSNDEKRVLDWVVETYGDMSAGAISDLSHREAAYKYTEPNEPIAYAYAKFFKHLPPKDLLNN